MRPAHETKASKLYVKKHNKNQIIDVLLKVHIFICLKRDLCVKFEGFVDSALMGDFLRGEDLQKKQETCKGEGGTQKEIGPIFFMFPFDS